VKKSDLKYYIGIILMFTIDSIPSIIFDNNDKYDVYLFYNHSRYLTNILFDISSLFNFSILSYYLIYFKKGIFKPLFYLSLFNILSYFIFYNQIGSLILIPIYVILVIIYNKVIK
jgi:hypothetical protein